MDKKEKKAVSVIINDEIWRRAKVVSFQSGVTMGSIIEDALSKEVERLEDVIKEQAKKYAKKQG